MHSNNTYKHIDDYFQYEIYANYKEDTKEMRYKNDQIRCKIERDEQCL
jgi:hypothetical protein